MTDEHDTSHGEGVNFYNDNDRHACAWLRELVRCGHIPPGDVSDTPIQEIKADDLDRYTQVHFFAGIGGWPLALALAGWHIDRPVWSGSCPCQPFSTAGKRKGEADDRHLWPHMHRLISQRRPNTVFGEQVASAIGHGWLDGISADLEAEGYAVGAAVLGAHSLGAPHQRQRLFWVSNPSGGRRETQQHVSWRQPDARGGGGVDERLSDAASRGQSEQRRANHPRHSGHTNSGRTDDVGLGDTQQHRLQGIEPAWAEKRPVERTRANGTPWGEYRVILCADGKSRRIEPGVIPLVDGVPGRVGRLRGFGNAIVPQVAAEFIAAFMPSAVADSAVD